MEGDGGGGGRLKPLSQPVAPPASHTVVPPCFFLALQDVLGEILVWLNSREGTPTTGLDDRVRGWIQEANAYLEDDA